MATTWRHTITLRTASTGAALTGQVVQLYEGDGSGDLVGTYTDNADGTYYLDLTSNGSVVGTIKVNGVVQTEKQRIAIIGGDILDHLTLDAYGGSNIASSVHGLKTGEGVFVGTTKTQSVTNKTFDNTNAIPAAAITSGTLALARIPSSIPDSKLATITTANKVSGSGVQLNSTAAGIEDSSGLRIKIPASDYSVEIDSDGLHVKLASYNPGLKIVSNGLKFDQATMDKLVTAYTVAWSAIHTSWGNRHNFDTSDDPGVAIIALDDALYQMRVDRETADTRFMSIYSQGWEATRNNTTAVASDPPGSSEYHTCAGDSTYRRKICEPFMKSPRLNRIIVRGWVSNSGTNDIKVRMRVINAAAGTEYEGEFTYATAAGVWYTINRVGNISELSSGLYFIAIDMWGDGGTTSLRGVNVFQCSESWITGEIDPAYWDDAEDVMN